MTGKKACGIIFLGCGLLFGPSFGQEPAIMKTVRSLYNEKTSLEASFDLHIFWKIREKQDDKSGRLWLAQGDKFHVELGSDAWVCDGLTYWQSSREDNAVQVAIRRFSAADMSMRPSQVLYTYLTNRGYRLVGEKGPETTVEWTPAPSAKQGETSCVRLTIDKKSGKIIALRVIDKDGNESAYRFKKTKIGAPPPKGIFQYSIPKGASVIDMRN